MVKSYLLLSKKPFSLIGEKKQKPVDLSMQKPSQTYKEDKVIAKIL